MTKKDYQLIATTFRSEYEMHKSNAGPVYGQEALKALRDIAGRFANQFALNNPNFDRARFLKACGVSE